MECPLSADTLVDICTSSNEWLSYIDCSMLINSLVVDGFIHASKENEDVLYALTPEGRETLAKFYIRIQHSLREEISRFVKKNGVRYQTKQTCKADYYQNKDGSYTVFLKILSPAQPLLELKLVVPDKKTASNIYRKWDVKAQDLFAAVNETLLD